MRNILGILILIPLCTWAQSTKTQVTADSRTTSKIERPSLARPYSGNANNIRLFPLNLLESSLHLAYEKRFDADYAWGVEASQTLGSSKALLYPDIEFQESYVGPFGQYYLSDFAENVFVEGGINITQAKISADVGLAGRSEKITKEQTYLMPHVTANYRVVTVGALTATLGAGVFAFFGGDELKINETRKGASGGMYSEKTTKVETPYSSNPKLRARVDLGYSF